MKLVIIGCGYVGLLTGTVIASENPTVEVHMIDNDKSKIERLHKQDHYIKEHLFAEYFAKVIDKNLFVSDDYETMSDADMIMIAVCTPSNEGKCNMTYFNSCVESIKKYARDDAIIIVKSTVPVSTTEKLYKELLKHTDEKAIIGDTIGQVANDLNNFLSDLDKQLMLSVIPEGTSDHSEDHSEEHSEHSCECSEEHSEHSCECSCEKCAETIMKHEVYNIPEFLAEGSAMVDLLRPIRILIGCTEKNPSKLKLVKSLFHYVPDDVIYVTDSNTSELSKLSSNFLLAARVAHINLLESIAKTYHANIIDISKILRMDSRIGHEFLSPSAAFGGSCFKKDIENLSSICEDRLLSKYIASVNYINKHHAMLLTEEIETLCIHNTERGKQSRVLFLGYGFKSFTEDPRESPTEMVAGFISPNILVDVYDPHIEEFNTKPDGKYNVVIIMNNEQEYRDIAKKCKEQGAIIVNPRYIDLE